MRRVVGKDKAFSLSEKTPEARMTSRKYFTCNPDLSAAGDILPGYVLPGKYSTQEIFYPEKCVIREIFYPGNILLGKFLLGNIVTCHPDLRATGYVLEKFAVW